MTGQEEVLQRAHSVQRNPAGIEQHLENCKKVIRLLLQVQIGEFNSRRLEKKEDEDGVAQLVVGLKKKAREACKIASTTGDAIRHAAKILFSPEELTSCTVCGCHTNKAVEQWTALDARKLNFLVSTVTKVFPNT